MGAEPKGWTPPEAVEDVAALRAGGHGGAADDAPARPRGVRRQRGGGAGEQAAVGVDRVEAGEGPGAGGGGGDLGDHLRRGGPVGRARAAAAGAERLGVEAVAVPGEAVEDRRGAGGDDPGRPGAAVLARPDPVGAGRNAAGVDPPGDRDVGGAHRPRRGGDVGHRRVGDVDVAADQVPELGVAVVVAERPDPRAAQVRPVGEVVLGADRGDVLVVHLPPAVAVGAAGVARGRRVLGRPGAGRGGVPLPGELLGAGEVVDGAGVGVGLRRAAAGAGRR